jgi:glyoxylase I family protein
MNKNFLHHICIQTNQYEQSLKFYSIMLGMEIIEETPDFHGRDFNTWIKNENLCIELQTPKKGQQFDRIDDVHAGVSHICFWVQDINQLYHELYEKGARSFIKHDTKDIYEVNGGKLFKLMAPEGTIIEFRDKMGC